MTAKRLDYFDMAKGIGIVLVVMGHLERLNEALRSFIQSFHMPLFFVIAGMLICYQREEEEPLPRLAAKKFRTVMIPYFSFGVLYFLIDLIAVSAGTVTLSQAFRNVVDTVTLYGVSVMWFLPALFLGELLFFCLLKKVPGRWLWAAYGALVLGAFLANGFLGRGAAYALYQSSMPVNILINFVRVFLRAAVASSFIAIGYLALSVSGGLRREEPKTLSGFFLGAGLVAADLAAYRLNGSVDLHFMILNNPALYYLFALAGSFGVVLMCRNLKPVKLLTFYGKNSLIVMATHINGYFVYIAVVISLYLNQFVTRAKDYVFCLCVLIILFAMEYPVILFFNRYLGFMLGRGTATKGAEKKNGQ